MHHLFTKEKQKDCQYLNSCQNAQVFTDEVEWIFNFFFGGGCNSSNFFFNTETIKIFQNLEIYIVCYI